MLPPFLCRETNRTKKGLPCFLCGESLFCTVLPEIGPVHTLDRNGHTIPTAAVP